MRQLFGLLTAIAVLLTLSLATLTLTLVSLFDTQAAASASYSTSLLVFGTLTALVGLALGYVGRRTDATEA